MPESASNTRNFVPSGQFNDLEKEPSRQKFLIWSAARTHIFSSNNSNQQVPSFAAANSLFADKVRAITRFAFTPIIPHSVMKYKVHILDMKPSLYSRMLAMLKATFLKESIQPLISCPCCYCFYQTVHERNIAFSCNNKLIEFIKDIVPDLKKVHFWSDSCCSQFHSQYVFRIFCYYPLDLEITWSYGEAHHFKWSHDGIGGSIKRKVYSDVSAQKVVIQNARHFATYSDENCNVNVLYLDKIEVQSPNIYDSSYIAGTL